MEVENNGIIYDGVLVRGTPRYRANKKMVATQSVPLEVRNQIDTYLRLEAERKESERAAAEEAEHLAEQVASVAAEAVNTSQATEPVAEAPLDAPLTPEDFLDSEDIDERGKDENTTRGFPENPIITVSEISLIEEMEAMRAHIFELENAKPASLSLEQLATKMYEDYGVYTVFVGHEPQDGDIHPFTTEPMTRYETGLAYSSFNKAVVQGKLNRDFTHAMDEVKRGREARDEQLNEFAQRKVDPYYNAPAYKTFRERTKPQFGKQSSTVTQSHNGDPISEEPTVETNIRSQTIRPTW